MKFSKLMNFKKRTQTQEEVYLQVNCVDTCCRFATGTGPAPGDVNYVEYNHCGRDCGNGREYGGGSVINETDQCCLEHDQCLSNGGDRCSCHSTLQSCLSGSGGIGAGVMMTGIWADERAQGC